MSGNSYCTIVPTHYARGAKEASRHTESQKIPIILTIHTLSTTSGSHTLAWYASLSLSSLSQYIHKVKLRVLLDTLLSMAHSMSAKAGSGSEAQMHNCSKSGDLVGIGGWANGRGSEDKVSKNTDKNNKKKAASGESLDRQSQTKNSKRKKSPMTRWLNEDRSAGPWSHVK
ncbi:hypothetical protein OIDMADRAFT_32275 [Oidiodendron maius Zn]|uniref:Uncharacterized protein n=1 Tax=Oidiodendron maius (strain Zn) TaxID=913774 RepID=A0A0C3H1L8_OIDMZ|nr:hypothetical protein OIDMADRAFT_32275 [Oidiodendron maius Zn]